MEDPRQDGGTGSYTNDDAVRRQQTKIDAAITKHTPAPTGKPLVGLQMRERPSTGGRVVTRTKKPVIIRPGERRRPGFQRYAELSSSQPVVILSLGSPSYMNRRNVLKYVQLRFVEAVAAGPNGVAVNRNEGE